MLLAMALVAAVPAASKSATPADLERKTWRAFQGKRVSEIRSLFTPDFVGLYADGTHDLQREIDGLKHVTIESYRLSNFESHAIDADDVLLTYAADVHGAFDRKHVSERFWTSSLWHRDHGRWRCVYHTEIKAK
jgi:hypothetical protein